MSPMWHKREAYIHLEGFCRLEMAVEQVLTVGDKSFYESRFERSVLDGI